jgi:hypothetical protein
VAFFIATQFLTIPTFFQWDLVLGGRVENEVQHAKRLYLRTTEMWVYFYQLKQLYFH